MIAEPSRRPFMPWALCAAVVMVSCLGAALMVRLWGRPVFPLDDPYITVHNIRALQQGYDTNFPGVSPLYGATSGVHLLLGAALSFAMQPRWALYLIGWAAVGLYSAGLLGLARALRLRLPETIAVLLLGLLSARTPQAMMNGLETGLGLAVATWMLVFAVRTDRGARIAAPLLSGIAPFVRPELAALAIALTALRWREIAFETSPSGTRRVVRALALDGAAAIATAAPWMAWYAASTGTPFPTTAGVKAAWFAQSCMPLNLHARLFGLALWEFVASVGPLVLGLIALVVRPVGLASLAFAVVFLIGYAVQLPSALAYNASRYAHVLIPVFVAGLAIASAPDNRPRVRLAARCVLVLSLLFGVVMFPSNWTRFAVNRAHTREYADTARFLLRTLPPDSRVLAHDVGYLSAATPFRIVDLVGLKSPGVAREHRDVTLATCGRSRGDVIAAVALREHATHLVVLRQWDEIYGFTNALVRHGWTLRVLRARSDGLDVYALTPPAGAAT